MPLLAVLVPGPVEIDGGVIHAAAKTIAGMEEFASHWPGEVAHVTELAPAGSGQALGTVARELEGLGYRVVESSDRLAALDALRPDVVLVNLSMSELPIIERCEWPVVVNVENDLTARLRWASLVERRRLPRVVAGLVRLEARYRRQLRRVAGVQANGWPAWGAYRNLNPRSMLYFDSRIRQDQLADSSGTAKSDSAGFTFAFSGRWIKPKGFLEAIEAFRRASAQRDGLSLHVLGSGELALPADAPSGVEVFGAVDFDAVWVPHVTSAVDAMLLPYPQSDPAGTYLEGVGCGAPFVAFANRQAAYLASEGLGWTVKMGDVAALADRMLAVADDPAALELKRRSGLEFMGRHTMEREFARRTEHLLECARAR